MFTVKENVGTNETFKIYLQINWQKPFFIESPDLVLYLKLRDDDEYTANFVRELVTTGKVSQKEQDIDTIYRSLDNVSYEPIILPTGWQAGPVYGD